MAKRILSVIIALVVSLGLIMASENIGGYIFQHPAVDMKDPKTVSNMMASMPIAAFLWLLLGYAVSSYIGGLIATLISGRQKMQPALIVGAFLLVGGIMNLISIPYHPLWFMIADVAVYFPFALLGYVTVKKKV